LGADLQEVQGYDGRNREHEEAEDRDVAERQKKTTLKKISDETYAEADDQKRKARQDAQISKVRASMTEEELAEMDAKRAEIVARAGGSEATEEAECI